MRIGKQGNRRFCIDVGIDCSIATNSVGVQHQMFSRNVGILTENECRNVSTQTQDKCQTESVKNKGDDDEEFFKKTTFFHIPNSSKIFINSKRGFENIPSSNFVQTSKFDENSQNQKTSQAENLTSDFNEKSKNESTFMEKHKRSKTNFKNNDNSRESNMSIKNHSIEARVNDLPDSANMHHKEDSGFQLITIKKMKRLTNVILKKILVENMQKDILTLVQSAFSPSFLKKRPSSGCTSATTFYYTLMSRENIEDGRVELLKQLIPFQKINIIRYFKDFLKQSFNCLSEWSFKKGKRTILERS